MSNIALTVNGTRRNFDGDPEQPLLWFLRDGLRLTGTKYGCGVAQCGACSVHFNGELLRSCSLPVSAVKPSDRILVSASSKRTQKSYEHPEWRESVWVGLLYDAGMNQRQADADGNSLVTVGEALRFAGYWAEVVTFYQRPYGRQSPRTAGMPVRGWTLADPPA